jgi:hypothetical protein
MNNQLPAVPAATAAHAMPVNTTPLRFSVTGDKYAPEFCHGDLVLVDDERELLPGCYVIFSRLSIDFLYIGKIDENGAVVAYPDGSDLPQDDLYIVGVISWRTTTYNTDGSRKGGEQ